MDVFSMVDVIGPITEEVGLKSATLIDVASQW